MNIDQLAQQHQNDYPGYLLADWYDTAIPTYELHLQVRLLTKQDLPAVEQFVLRLLDAGVKNPTEMAQILGVDFEIVSRAMETLNRSGYIIIVPARSNGHGDTITITTKGRELLRDLTMNQIVNDAFVVCLDGITGEHLPYRPLMQRQSARDSGRHMLPAVVSRPTIDSLDVASLKRLWDDSKQSLPKDMRTSELLDVQAIDKMFVSYRPARVLQYVNQESREVLVQVYDNRDRMQRHEAVIMRLENSNDELHLLRVERKPTGVSEQLPDPIREVISGEEYELVQRKAVELPRLQSAIQQYSQEFDEAKERQQNSASDDERKQLEQSVIELKQKISSLEDQVVELSSVAPATEVLSMVEHRPRMIKALGEAKRRVIVISPWLNPVALNVELRQAISNALARGVRVCIGHGFGEETIDERRSVEDLEKLRNAKNGHLLKVVRLDDTHAKVIICDEDYMITTSFNWLSFAGRRDWGNRVEFGTLTRDKSAVRRMISMVGPMLGINE
jgi:DNA-binding MarR family transcriptional regulator